MYFHDALCKRIVLDLESQEVWIEALVYQSEESQDRQSVSIKFEGVSHCSFTGNITEIVQNAFAGNIVDACITQTENIQSIQLTGGTLLVCSEMVKTEAT